MFGLLTPFFLSNVIFYTNITITLIFEWNIQINYFDKNKIKSMKKCNPPFIEWHACDLETVNLKSYD